MDEVEDEDVAELDMEMGKSSSSILIRLLLLKRLDDDVRKSTSCPSITMTERR